MGSDRDIVILTDDVDILVGRMRDDIDLGIAEEKVRQHVAHCELHGGDRRCASHGADWFDQAMPDGGLGVLGFTQHHHGVAIESSPASVIANRRDVRFSSLTPRLVSNCRMRWLRVDFGIRSVLPADVKPPRSTTCTK